MWMILRGADSGELGESLLTAILRHVKTRQINPILVGLNQGVRLGWFIDPEEQTVIRF
jgi:hypothetical protein